MKLIDYIKFNEGLKLRAYRDQNMIWTIGYGCTGEGIVDGLTWTKEKALAECEIRCAQAEEEAHAVIGRDLWLKLNDVRRVVLCDMAYQMGGHGLSLFHRTLAAVSAGKWDEASVAMLQSKWAKQTPNRARRNAAMMLTGTPLF